MTRSLLAVAVGSLLAAPAAAQPKEAPGYWKFDEVVRVEYPKEKVHRLYPVEYAFDGGTLTAVAKALNGNDPKVVHTEERQAWSWTPPPAVLVPGEKVPMTLSVKIDRTKFDKAPGLYIGGGINAGFMPPKPTGAAAYHVGSDLRTEKGGPGGLSPRDADQGGPAFAPATYTRESVYVVPGRQTRFIVKDHPDRISFRVGGVVGSTREFNTIYEYKWVAGPPPADRGGPAGVTPKDKPAGGPAAGGPTGGGRWEYRVLDLGLADVFGEGFERRLTDLGNDGWELVGVVSPPAAGGQQTVRLILKRPRR